MHDIHSKRAAGLAMAALLAGCGGGGGSSRCDSITGGGATVTASGPIDNRAAAADGNLGSHASLRLRSTAQTGSVRATAQSGIVYPAGSVAGAFVSFLNQGSNITGIRTYLNGMMVESATPGANFIFEPASGGTGAELFVGFTTRAQFNAVEFVETDNGSSGNAEYRVYELCSDGRP